ncbi:hypothetical protein NL476_28425, partial [Klebsiella pneumoniae]|nr:hypothetical protein [Klebsiella pneumoniae]
MLLPMQEDPISLLDILGIDDALLFKPDQQCRFSEPLARFLATQSEDQKIKATSFQNVLEHLKALLALIPKKCSWQCF